MHVDFTSKWNNSDGSCQLGVGRHVCFLSRHGCIWPFTEPQRVQPLPPRNTDRVRWNYFRIKTIIIAIIFVPVFFGGKKADLKCKLTSSQPALLQLNQQMKSSRENFKCFKLDVLEKNYKFRKWGILQSFSLTFPSLCNISYLICQMWIIKTQPANRLSFINIYIRDGIKLNGVFQILLQHPSLTSFSTFTQLWYTSILQMTFLLWITHQVKE